MSTVDNRIVRMQFDNAQFEAGVMRSMKTLDALNEKLQFKEASKGASALQVAVANIEGVSSSVLSSAMSGLDKLSHYSTTIVGKIADNIKTDIAGAITSVIKSITSIPDVALSQIKSGGWNRASNIADAQFRIEGLGYSWEKVRDAADYAVTDTAYGLDAAAKAASQLAASGVDFEKVIERVGETDLTQMHKALRGISGVAAMTNSSFDEIANIFTKVAGMGVLHATELNSISIRGINAAATMAEYLGVTEQDIHEMTRKNMIDFETFAMAMDSAFGEHAKEANRTFTGSLSNMKAALNRIGAIFAQPVIDKTNTLFIAVTTRIKEFQKALSDASNEDGSKVARFATHFAEAWESAIAAASAFVYSLDLSWFENIGAFLDKVAIKLKTVFDGITEFFSRTKNGVAAATGAIGDSLQLDLQDLDLLHRILDNEFGFVEERWGKLDEIYKEQGSPKTGLWLQGYMDQLAAVGYKFEELGWTEEQLTASFEEQTKSLTAQEVLYANIASAVEFFKTIVGGVKGAVKGLLGGVVGIGRAIGESFLAITKGFHEGFLGSKISERFSYFTAAFAKFAEAIRPSVSVMEILRGAASKVSDTLSNVIIKVISAGESVFHFAADVLSGRKSIEELKNASNLTPIEQFAAGFIRVFTNLKNIATNAFSSVVKILRSVRKAFNNVFKPEAVASNLASFTDRFADLSDVFKISDETATKLQSTFESIFSIFSKFGGVITKAFSKLTSFFSKGKGLGAFGSSTAKAAKEVVDLSKDVVDVSVNTEKAEGIFDRLRIIFYNVIETIKGAPSKIKALFDTLKHSEGVQNLKTSFERLKKSIRDMLDDVLPPAEQAMEVFGVTADDAADQTENKLVKALSLVANGISLVVDGLTWLFEQLPTWRKNIEDFFKTLTTGAVTAYNFVKEKIEGFGNAIGIDKLFDDITEIWNNVGEENQTLGQHIGSFITLFFESLGDAIGQIDWSGIGKVSLLTIVGATLYKFFGVMSNIEDLTGNIADVPKQISGVFKNFGEIFKMAATSMGRMTNAMIFMSYAASLVMLCGALILIADLPWEKTKTALSVMTMLAIILLVLSKVSKNMNESAKRLPALFQKSTNTFAQIQAQIPKLFGVAAVILSITLFLKFMVDAIKELAPVVDTISDSGFESLLKALGAVSAMLIVVVTMMALIGSIAGGLETSTKDKKDRKLIFDGKKLAGMFVGVALLIAAIGAAIYLLVKAMSLIHTDNIEAAGIWTVIGVLALLGTISAVAIKFAQGVNHKAILSAALLVGLIAGSIYLIITQITILSAELVLAEKTGNGEAMAAAIGAVIGSIMAIGIAIGAMISSLKGLKVDTVKEIKLILLAMAGVILVIGIAFSMMANAFSASKEPDAAVGGVTVSLILFGILAQALNQIAQKLGKINWKELTVIFAGLSVVFLSMALAIAVIGAVFTEDNFGSAAGGVVLGIALFGVVTLLLERLAENLKGIEPGKIIEIMGAISIALLAVAASVLIISVAAMAFSNANVGGVIAAIGSVIVMVGLLGGLIWALSKSKMSSEKLNDVVDIMLTLGGTMLMISVAALILAKACEVMGNVSPDGMKRALIPIGVMVGLFIVLVGILALMSGLGGPGTKLAAGKIVDIMKGVADAFLRFGIALTAMGLAVMLLGAGAGILAGGLGKLAEGLAKFAVTFEKHTAAVVTLIILVGIIAAVIGILLVKFTQFGKTAINIMGAVEKKTGGLGEKFHKVFDGIKKKIGESPEKFKKWWKNLQPKAKVAIATGIVTILGGIAAATPEALSQIGTILFTVLEWIISMVPKLVSWIVKFLIVVLNGLADAIRNNAAGLVAAITNVVEALVEVILHVFGVILTTLASWLGFDMGEETAAMIADIALKLRQGQADIEKYADSFNRLTQDTAEAREELDKFRKKSKDPLGGLGGNLQDDLDHINEMKDTLGTLNLDKVDGVISNSAVSDWILNGGSDADEGMLSKWLGDGNISDKVADAKDGMTDMAKWLGGDSVAGKVSEFKDGITDAVDLGDTLSPEGMGVDSIPEEYGDLGHDSGNEFETEYANSISNESSKQEAYDAGANLVNESARGVEESKWKIEEASYATNVRGVTNPMYANSKAYFDAGYNSQEMIEKGKAKARTDYSSINIKEAKESAHSYWMGFNSKDGIDAHSPSKKFYQSGLWCILGFQQAIKDNAYLATGQMSSLGSSMVDAIGEPLDYVSKIASGDLEYDPRIRPVMDLSNIGRTAGDVSSMFANQNVTLSGITGQIAYDMTNLNGSNAAVVAEIQALREDMDYMTDELSNMQIVMDTGALVGSTVGAYDQAFGRRAIYGERGN